MTTVDEVAEDISAHVGHNVQTLYEAGAARVVSLTCLDCNQSLQLPPTCDLTTYLRRLDTLAAELEQIPTPAGVSIGELKRATSELQTVIATEITAANNHTDNTTTRADRAALTLAAPPATTNVLTGPHGETGVLVNGMWHPR
jgi:hypothetical protein